VDQTMQGKTGFLTYGTHRKYQDYLVIGVQCSSLSAV